MLPLTEAEALSSWFLENARTYPWSETRDAYAVWISEVMLQQTVVTAVLAHYQRWMARWPTLAALAGAEEPEVLRAWEGLGYYSRARNLWRAARILTARGLTTLPSGEEELLALPGFGAYTAAAVRSFAYGRPVLAVDANLKRIFQRLEALETWTSEVEARFRTHADRELFPFLESRLINAALMQLGQRVCTPRSPLCGVCPLAKGCQARLQGRQEQIPPKKERKLEELMTAVGIFLRNRGHELFIAQPGQGRFSSLWLFPPAEGQGIRLTSRIHTYTRFKDRLSPQVFLTGEPVLPPGWTGRWVTWAEVENIGMPSVYRKILDEARSMVLALTTGSGELKLAP